MKYQIYNYDGGMSKITLEDVAEAKPRTRVGEQGSPPHNSTLLVSPEHRVYGELEDQTNPSSSFNSWVDTNGTLFSTISLNSGSLDQILTSEPKDLYFKANAVYGKSS